MRRLGFLFLFLAALLLAVPVAAAPPVHHATPWWHYDLKFWAPFDDPRSPLRLLRGTGSLTFTRAHDATHTATYVYPGTGLVTVASANQLRIEAAGALIEGARTNSLLWSRAFDNAVWIATNVTLTKNQIGEDGVYNSAYTLTATADNGTLCQAVTIGSAAYSGAFSLERVGGTGAVQLSLDNGATYGTSVTASLSTSVWYRASKANQTLANPELCIRMATSGDSVAIDYAQLEAGTFASSRIPTTTAAVTRNLDALTALLSGNVSATAGTASAIIDIPAGNSTVNVYFISVGTLGNGGQILNRNDQNKIRISDGTNSSTGVTYPTDGSTGNRVAGSYSDNSMRACVNGTCEADKTFDGNISTSGVNMSIGKWASTGEREIFGHIKHLRLWNRAFTDAELQFITR
jgi:hypothetical protein